MATRLILEISSFSHLSLLEWICRAGENVDLQPQYEKTLKLLEIDPFHPSLRLHRLQGPLSELHSVSINIRYRITLELVIQGHKIIPVDIGSHDEI
jgi:toxin HigB-1